jgi:hypothetical protein
VLSVAVYTGACRQAGPCEVGHRNGQPLSPLNEAMFDAHLEAIEASARAAGVENLANNLKIASALGLTIPQSMLTQATEVIG